MYLSNVGNCRSRHTVAPRQYYSQNLMTFSHFVGFFLNVKLLLRDEIARQKL